MTVSQLIILLRNMPQHKRVTVRIAHDSDGNEVVEGIETVTEYLDEVVIDGSEDE